VRIDTVSKLSALALSALLLTSCAHVENGSYKEDVTTWYAAFNTKDPALVDKILAASWDDLPPAPGSSSRSHQLGALEK
jgi:hypothetical protein